MDPHKTTPGINLVCQIYVRIYKNVCLNNKIFLDFYFYEDTKILHNKACIKFLHTPFKLENCVILSADQFRLFLLNIRFGPDRFHTGECVRYHVTGQKFVEIY